MEGEVARYSIGWIAPLPLELIAAKAVLDKDHGDIHVDGYIYHGGEIGKHNIVMAVQSRMGTDAASDLAARMRAAFRNIEYFVVVGIGGGVPGYGSPGARSLVVLGDVVVSYPRGHYGGVIRYDFGAWTNEDHLKFMSHTNSPPDSLLNAVNVLQARHSRPSGTKIPAILQEMRLNIRVHERQNFEDPGAAQDRLFQNNYLHPEDSANEDCENCCDLRQCQTRQRRGDGAVRQPGTPKIHYGNIASSNQLQISASKRNQLHKDLGVICFEMEGAGVIQKHPCLVIRGICDYSDSHKNKKWQPYAAAAAAAYTKELLEIMPTSKSAKSHSASKLIEDDSIKYINPQSDAATVFICIALLYFRDQMYQRMQFACITFMIWKTFMTSNSRLPLHLNPWSELPAFLEDAHLRRFPIHLATIDSWAVFDLILEEKFNSVPGYPKVKNRSYMLEDSITHIKLKRSNAFKKCFRPGRTILMSMLFRHTQHEESSCPSCRTVNIDSGGSAVHCYFCGMQYRRVTEVTEGDEERSSIRSSSAEGSKENLNGKRLFSGPRTPAEADHADEDVAEFKRVQIVAPPNFPRYASEDMQGLSLEPLAKIPGEFPSGDMSGIPRDIEWGFALTGNTSEQPVPVPPPPPPPPLPIPGAGGSILSSVPPSTIFYATETDITYSDSDRRRRRAERARAKLARLGGSRVEFS